MKTHNYFITAVLFLVCCTNTFCQQWTYNKKVDEMTDETEYFAINIGTNNSGIKGKLELWSNGKVSISITKGFFAPSTAQYRLTVRFDKQPALHLNCEGSSDRKTLFFPHPISIINKIKAAKTMLVEFDFSTDHSGVFIDNPNLSTQLIKFNIADLKWEH